MNIYFPERTLIVSIQIYNYIKSYNVGLYIYHIVVKNYNHIKNVYYQIFSKEIINDFKRQTMKKVTLARKQGLKLSI